MTDILIIETEETDSFAIGGVIGTGLSIDWGDGTTESISSGDSITHNYTYHAVFTVTISGDTITGLSDNCFTYNATLASITIPSSVTNIGDNCFEGCENLLAITIPDGVTNLGDYCFANCANLINVEIGSGLSSLPESCFNMCINLQGITIPSNITSIGDNCFENCYTIREIEIPNTVTSLSSGCFSACEKLLKANIGNGITVLPDYLFYGCTRLSQVNLPNTILTIGDGCFYNCTNIVLSIPDSVTSLGDNVFYCEEIIFEGNNPPSATSSTFHNTATIYTPIGRTGFFEGATNYPSCRYYENDIYNIYTLNGALRRVGKLIASNILSLGIRAYELDGLTTLANKIVATRYKNFHFIVLFDDEYDEDGQRPSNVKVTLTPRGYVGVEYVTYVTGTSFNNNTGYSGYIYELPILDDDDNPIVYDWVLGTDGNNQLGQNPSYDGFYSMGDYLTEISTYFNTVIIIMRHTRVKTEKTIRIIWNDNNNSSGIRPSSVNATLVNMNDTSQRETYTLTSSGSWTVTAYPNKYYNKGFARYTWSLQSVTGYMVRSIQENGNETVITLYTRIPPGPTPE